MANNPPPSPYVDINDLKIANANWDRAEKDKENDAKDKVKEEIENIKEKINYYNSPNKKGETFPVENIKFGKTPIENFNTKIILYLGNIGLTVASIITIYTGYIYFKKNLKLF